MKKKITLAGGCFWCIEASFFDLKGVLQTACGYMGDEKREVVEIEFDAESITLAQILDIFWRHIDPFDAGGQFADRGVTYQTAIYYHEAEQKIAAEKSKKGLEKHFGKAIATQILPATTFTLAEAHHQKFCLKNPTHYKQYSQSHEAPLDKIWNTLTPLQYEVTHHAATEPPFDNAYWDHKEEGIYVDIISGVPLFSSEDKFDSGTGWPSFSQTLNPEEIITQEDHSLGTPRIEVKARTSGAHLGHLFPDGPPPTGQRFCINSASLRFIPKKDS